MSLREGLLTASSHLVFSSEALQSTAGIADDAEGAEEDRQADPLVPGGHARPAGHALARRASSELQETPAFPVHTVDTLGAGDVFHGAFALAIHRKSGAPARRCGSPPPPRR